MWMNISQYVTCKEVRTLRNKEIKCGIPLKCKWRSRGLQEQFASFYDKTKWDFVKIKFCV